MSSNLRQRIIALSTAVLMAFVLFAGTSAHAKEYLIGLMTDRSGPIKNMGPPIGNGFHDYLAVFNKKNSIPGHTVRAMEIDMGYNLPRALEAYERFKAEGAVTISLLGTHVTIALTPRLTEDKILGMSPGFGSAAAANGERFPYLFPAAASYWSQAATAIDFMMKKWDQDRPMKLAYLHYDNPAGREPFIILDELTVTLGRELRKFAVPLPGLEMRPQMLDIARRFKADWMLTLITGQALTVSLKEASRLGFPRDRILGTVWGGGEPEISAAGWDRAEGYFTMQFTHVGSSRKNLNHPILKEIADIYRERGDELPETMDASTYYNRGVSWAAMHSEAIRRAVAKNGPDITGEDVKNAMETIQNYSLDNFMNPVTFSKQDHEGGGFVRIYQIHDSTYRPATEWIQSYRDVVEKHVMAGS